jgi:hypothetical protein
MDRGRSTLSSLRPVGADQPRRNAATRVRTCGRGDAPPSRLLAFALILAAIIDKNRSRPGRTLGGSQNGSQPQRGASEGRSPARY